MNSNLALPPSMLCESVAHNALQQQDSGNYHNQRRGSSISGGPQGVNEAERRRSREGDREVEGRRTGFVFVGRHKTPKVSSEKSHTHN